MQNQGNQGNKDQKGQSKKMGGDQNVGGRQQGGVQGSLEGGQGTIGPQGTNEMGRRRDLEQEEQE